MSIEDIKELYDPNIYYNNDIVITTYNKHIAVLEMGKNTMKVNDTEIALDVTMKEKKGVLYLPFSEMTDVYDFEENYNSETKVVTIDSTSIQKKEAVVLRNTSLKESTKKFAKTSQETTGYKNENKILGKKIN